MYILQWNNDQSGTWYEVDDSGQVQSHKVVADLSACPQIDKDAKLAVLLPGRLVRTLKLTLPKMRVSERSKAIPFLLEEQLASEPGLIDVVVGDEDVAGQFSVAVFDKERFKAKLSQLQEHNLHADIVLPDYLALPLVENTWSLAPLNGAVLVRTGLQAGFVIDITNVATVLKKALAQAAADNAMPEKIICYQQDDVIDQSQLASLDIKVVFQEVANETLFDFTALFKSPAINMLQGAYRPKVKLSAQKRNWQVAIGALVVWLVLLFGGHVVQWFYYSHQGNKISAQVLKVYQSIFPGAQSVLEPRFRVGKMLDTLKKESQDDVFLRVFAMSGKILDQYPTVILQSVNFENKKLALTVTAKDTAALSRVRSEMRQQGLSVDQAISKPDDKTVNATLTIQEAS